MLSLVLAVCGCGGTSTHTKADGGADLATPNDATAVNDSSMPPAGDGSTPTIDSSMPAGDGGGVVAGSVRYLGRVDTSNPNAPKLSWSGSGLIATVSGTKISVSIKSEDSDVEYQPVIDGKVATRFLVANGMTQTVTIGDNLSAGNHTVELYRDTEGSYGDSVFLGFIDGKLVGAPASNGRLIEIIGDSISAGYGNLGVEIHPPYANTCTFSIPTEAAYQAYSEVLARELDAEASVVARSGWGVYRDGNSNTSNVLPAVYAQTFGYTAMPAWSFSAKPNAVLINLGTNDSAQGDPGTPYETAYVAFLKTIRGHYPDAWIFLTMGPLTSDPELTMMNTHIANVVKTFADAKVVQIEIPVQDVSMTGCDYHPDTAEDKIMADALAPMIKAKLGW